MKLIVHIWMFPKIGVFPPKSSILIGFSMIFTIHFGGPPLFLETPKFDSFIQINVSFCYVIHLRCTAGTCSGMAFAVVKTSYMLTPWNYKIPHGHPLSWDMY